MATFEEIAKAAEDPGFGIQMRGAVVSAADVVRQEATDVENHAQRLKWAKRAYIDPYTMADQMKWAVLGQNKFVDIILSGKVEEGVLLVAVLEAVNVFAQE